MSSSRSRRRFAQDASGVSEVISFLFSFLMAIMILVMSLYAFGQVNASARHLSAQAELRDVVNRVAVVVQETLKVAQARFESAGRLDAVQLRYDRTLSLPPSIQGWDYTVTLDPSFVTGKVPARDLTIQKSTFNAKVDLPPGGLPCTSFYVVCGLCGENAGSKASIVVSYLFDNSVVPPTPAVNAIQLDAPLPQANCA